MSGRGEGQGRGNAVGWIRGVLVAVVIAAVAVAVGKYNAMTIKRPALGAVNIVGLVLMLVGLAASLATQTIAAKKAERGEGFPILARLAGVLICGIGAMMVFL